MSETQGHSWPRIFGIFATGVAVAFLVGKVPAALPVLRTELGLTLVEAGLLVSLLSLVSGLGGVFIGAMAAVAGQRLTALGGLVVAVAAGIGGSLAVAPGQMLAARAIEGIGFFMCSVSLPALIMQLSDDRRRQSAMGLWGAYLPLGAGIILLAGGVMIALIGWRGLWVAISVALAVMVAVLVWAAPASEARGARTARFPDMFAAVGLTLKAPGAVMLALTFGCYSGQYIALTSFVPLILVEEAGWALATAAAAGAIVMLGNALGNVIAGYLLDRDFRRATLIVAAAGAMAIGSALVMSSGLPVPVRLAGALLFSICGGMIPGALFAGVRQHAPSPAHVSTVNGLMLQSSSIGQFIGPALASALVSAGGGDWSWSLIYLLPMAAATALVGIGLGRIEAKAEVATS